LSMPKAGCISGPRNSNRLRAILLNVLTVAPLVCLSVVCLSATCFGQAANKVTAVRFWSAGDTTRVAVEVSGEFKYKSDSLETPPRLFFDVQGARPVMTPKTIPVGDRLLKQIRVAETQPGTTRIVLDLEQDADFTASQLSNPERLMVELRVKGAKRPATAAVEEPEPQPAAKAAPEVAAKPLPGSPVLTAVSRPAGVPTVTASRKSELPEPKAAARNSNGERSLTRALDLKLGRVVIDPRWNCAPPLWAPAARSFGKPSPWELRPAG
jgi:N-acetylmuramoyl-L-alanine amidase